MIKINIYPILKIFFFIGFNSAFAAIQHDKWIVVTTIQHPTPALKKLAQLQNWQLLVIGDKKTPSDWYLDENCIYLSPQDQDALPFKLAKLLPWNHYARKNIGYLYAIAHGAKIIYETDDDNYIDDIQIFRNTAKVTLLDSNDPVINVYDHFGQPTLWPRGYPLSYIRQRSNYTHSPFKLPEHIVIEQGLVNNDPDVDAIFRLTRQDASNIVFDATKHACVLARGVFCPFNTQNTLFHQEAFWGLYIPKHVPFRVCDIWRGYITQRLLWETGNHLCFTRPTAIQERNDHDLIKDFIGEQDLYLKTEFLIDALRKWRPSKTNHIYEHFHDIYTYVIKNQFIRELELELINAWISDLRDIQEI